MSRNAACEWRRTRFALGKGRSQPASACPSAIEERSGHGTSVPQAQKQAQKRAAQVDFITNELGAAALKAAALKELRASARALLRNHLAEMSDGQLDALTTAVYALQELVDVTPQTSDSTTSAVDVTRQGGPLEPEELTVLVSWAEALAEALTCAPERLETVAAEARTGAAWRTALALADPSPELDQALESINEVVRTAISADADQRVDALLLATRTSRSDASPIHRLACRAIRSAVEQRQARTARTERTELAT